MSTATLTCVQDRLCALAEEATSSPGFPEAPSDPALAKLRQLGTELWLDTGGLDEARRLWRREFSGFTVNNTLANQVVQTGLLDDEIRNAAHELAETRPDITEEELVMELGFIANCHIALRLVKAFGAKVSVELHPALADDIERTVVAAERYYAVCPERFIIKIPHSPDGCCAAARVCARGIPVNYTLGFSARQNYLVALLANPTYCNVFLGRLNSFVSDNRLGDGKFVGEKATLASQAALRSLRDPNRVRTRQIAASMRAASQVYDLAGVDVYTLPTRVVKEFLDAAPDPNRIEIQVNRSLEITLNPTVDRKRLDILWEIDEAVRRLGEELKQRDILTLTGDDLRAADADYGTGLFHRFTSAETVDILRQGKIPDWNRWEVEQGIALDDLMTQSALQAFVKDQTALDDRLRALA